MDPAQPSPEIVADEVAVLAAKLRTPAECALMGVNVLAKGREDIAVASRERAIDLSAIVSAGVDLRFSLARTRFSEKQRESSDPQGEVFERPPAHPAA